ncbi:MAG: response regulator [SAR324 cluster bacterium]|nr:response regulator [SAR324 cluster bacterium]
MKKILIIDDEKQIRKYLKTFLDKDGYHTIGAADGAAGLVLLKECLCDLVITDIYMPNKEGIETIREIKSEYPAIKIIAISGGGICDMNILNTATLIGADFALEKPIEEDHLLYVVRDLIGPA